MKGLREGVHRNIGAAMVAESAALPSFTFNALSRFVPTALKTSCSTLNDFCEKSSTVQV